MISIVITSPVEIPKIMRKDEDVGVMVIALYLMTGCFAYGFIVDDVTMVVVVISVMIGVGDAVVVEEVGRRSMIGHRSKVGQASYISTVEQGTIHIPDNSLEMAH